MYVMNSVSRHVNQIETAIASQASSALAASWRRSLSAHKIDPADRRPPQRVTDTQLKEAQQLLEPLMRVADGVLDRLFQAVGGAGCCVLLTDASGVVLSCRNAPADDRTFQSWGLCNGTIWSEDREGTNGIGTCIAEHRLLTIHCAQHFRARNTLMSCTAAPIFDHHGRLAAVLDVSSCRADHLEDFVPLIKCAVSDAARRIEIENFRASFPHARISIPPVEDHHTSAALIATDSDDLVIGANRLARLQFGITQDSIDRGLPAGTLIRGMTNDIDAFAEAERGVLHRALAEVGGSVTAAAKTLGVSRATLHRKMKKMGIARHR